MLLVHGIPTTAIRSWRHKITEPESKPTSPTILTLGKSSQITDSWVGVNEEPIKTPNSEYSTPASASCDDQVSFSRTALRCNTPTSDPELSGTAVANNSHSPDTATFSPHAIHLLPSEPNGTWRTRASYAVTNPSESSSTLRGVLNQHVHELDVPALLHKLRQIVENRRDDFDGWLNRSLAGYDLIKMHNRLRRLVPVPSMPNMHQIDHAVDTMTEIAQSLRKQRSESELLEQYRDDKYIFAEVICRKAWRALIEQGICNEWQLQCEGLVRMQHAVHAALLQTFTCIQKVYRDVPLFRARPEWIAKRETKVWRLELDIGVVGVEVGPVTDKSLIELGFIDTGFELPESCGCASIMDIDRQAQGIEDEWQLLEA